MNNSEKVKPNYIKSCKITNKDSVYLTHDKGVDTYQIENISEIELDFLKKTDHLFFSKFFGNGLIFILIFSIISTFFVINQDTDYFEKLWLILPLGFTIIYFILFVFSDSIVPLFFPDKEIVYGRKLTIYSLDKGKIEYYIGCWDYEKVMSNDFFILLFSKSTMVNNLIKNEDDYLGYKLGAISRRDYSWRKDRLKEYFVFLYISFFSVFLFSIWFYFSSSKIELIPLIGSNCILFLIEIMKIIEAKWDDKKLKVYNWKDKYLEIFNESKQYKYYPKENLIYSGKLKDLEISADSVHINLKISNSESYYIYLNNDKEFFLNKLNLITTYGISHLLNIKKGDGLSVFVYEETTIL